MRPSKLRLPESTEQTARSASFTTFEISSRQRAGVADARRAAVADEVEAERLQRLGQAGAVVVLGDDLRAGRQRGLHPRLRAQPARDRVAREQPGAEHHRRVRGVRAARDRRDHDVAVVERRLGAVRERDRRLHASVARASPTPPPPCGCACATGSAVRRVLRRRSGRSPGRCPRPHRRRRPARARSRRALGGRRPARRVSAIRSCGRFGPAMLGTTSPRSSSSVSLNVGASLCSSCHSPCSFA